MQAATLLALRSFIFVYVRLAYLNISSKETKTVKWSNVAKAKTFLTKIFSILAFFYSIDSNTVNP